MKRIKLMIVGIVLAMVSSCYDDSDLRSTLDDYGRRISALEQLCKEMNTNISSLQTLVNALQNNDYVTGVNPVIQGTTAIGYTISFSKSAPITIYHGRDGQNGKDGTDGKDGVNGTNGKDGADGKDGKDGVDGKDGSTPIIGVTLSSDGIYYWTLNGSWLLDADGNKIPAVCKGGKDGVTPQLKIEEDYWYISYDNGASWTRLGKATGENGEGGQNGTEIFKSFNQDSNNIYLTLVDGTVITIPKTPKLLIVLRDIPTNVKIGVRETITTSYELKNASSNPIVTASSDGGFIVKLTRTTSTTGKLTIKATDQSENGYVNIIATDDTGRSAITVITLVIYPYMPEPVDLGLSVKWASFNLGATAPEEYGAYYAWGETSPQSNYSESTSLTYGKSISELKSRGIIDANNVLTPQYDAASSNLGGNWRMPTSAEQQELMDKCKWTWATQNGVNGCRVTGPNGNSIFLPIAGGFHRTNLNNVGTHGYYWSSSANANNTIDAYYMYVVSDYHAVSSLTRYGGLSIRPVSD